MFVKMCYVARKKAWALHIPDNDRMNVADKDHVLDEQVIGKFPYLILSLLHVLFKCSKHLFDYDELYKSYLSKHNALIKTLEYFQISFNEYIFWLLYLIYWKHYDLNSVEPSGVQALKNPNPLKVVEALFVLVVAMLV